jgi:L-aspartate oxidase
MAVAPQAWKSELAARLAGVMPESEAWLQLPLIEEIRDLKVARRAVVIAHNYQVPPITAGVADFTGDSLAMARFAAQTDADTIVVCGVRFMAETAKLLSPARRVLLPATEAGCSLAESVTAVDVRALRARYPDDVVTRVISCAAEALTFLEACGVDFDRDGSGRSLHLEAGPRRARVAHAAGDRSGEAIVAALWARAHAATHVDIQSGWRAVELLAAAREGVAGAQIVDALGRSALVHARETVLATGGIGRLYRLTTNGEHATGDGLAMALAIGARTAALEFVQFHPTALRVDADPLPLLTEALRGAGARLITARGAPVMAGRHMLGDLAPRDVVARTVWEHAQAGEDVLLDATAVFGSDKGSAFPGARRTALSHGIDPAVAPLPVTAAAHYHMGGVVVDASGRTSLPGLWACGEVAYTGLHGANRLASNSLLEAVVCGTAVGAAIAAATSRRRPVVTSRRLEIPVGVEADSRLTRLRERMWQAMGPVRNAVALNAALAATLTERGGMPPEDKLVRLHFELAAAMIFAATTREESRGAHWRSDFPRRDPTRDGPRAVYPRGRRGQRGIASVCSTCPIAVPRRLEDIRALAAKPTKALMIVASMFSCCVGCGNVSPCGISVTGIVRPSPRTSSRGGRHGATIDCPRRRGFVRQEHAAGSGSTTTSRGPDRVHPIDQ